MNKQDLKEIKKIVEDATEPHFAAIQNEFRRIDGRFEQIDKQFDRIDERFDKLEGRVDFLAEKIYSFERRIIAIEDMLTEQGKLLRKHTQELSAIRKDIGEIKRNQKGDHKKIIVLEHRVVRIEQKVFVKA